jgi:cytochrome c-type biogenesis protein CcmH
VRRLGAALALATSLVAAAPALASEQHPTQNEIESEIVCPVCAPATLDQSSSAVAQRMKRFITRRRAAGDTKSEIESKLVAQFGEQVLAAPPKKGFNLIAWVLPIVGVVAGAAVLAALAWRWSRKRADGPGDGPPGPPPNGRVTVDPELERRLDEELARFDA